MPCIHTFASSSPRFPLGFLFGGGLQIGFSPIKWVPPGLLMRVLFIGTNVLTGWNVTPELGVSECCAVKWAVVCTHCSGESCTVNSPCLTLKLYLPQLLTGANSSDRVAILNSAKELFFLAISRDCCHNS